MKLHGLTVDVWLLDAANRHTDLDLLGLADTQCAYNSD